MVSSFSGKEKEKGCTSPEVCSWSTKIRGLWFSVFSLWHHLLGEGKKAESWKFISKPPDQLRGTL